MVLPSREVANVKSIEVAGRSTSLAYAGDGVDIALTGVQPDNLIIGGVLCHPVYPAPMSTRFKARVVLLDLAMPVLKGMNCIMHCHTLRESGIISELVSLLDSKTGEVIRNKPRCLTKNQAAVIEVTTSRPVCVEEYALCKALGRVALRDAGKTIAVGIIIGITDH